MRIAAGYFAAVVLLVYSATAVAAGEQYRFRKIADSTTIPPGAAEPLTVFDELAFDGHNVALSARTASGLRGVYRWDGDTLTTIADTQTIVPGDSVAFHEFHSLAIDAGHVAFVADGATTMKRGVYTDLGGSLRCVADEMTAMPSGGGAIFDDFTAAHGVAIDGPTIAFTGRGAAGAESQEGVYVETSGALARIVDRSTVIPGSIETFNFMGEVDVSAGSVVFLGGEGGQGGLNGVYTTAEAPPGGLHVVVDKNSVIGGLVNPLSFLSPNSVRIDGSDRAFAVRDALNNRGVYRETAGVVTKVADKFTLDPLTGAAFTSLNAYSLADGAVAFHGSTGPGGIYVEQGGELTNVIKAGDSLQGKLISTLNLFANSLEGGRIAFAAKFNDQTAAAYLAEPLNLNPGPDGHTFWPLFDAEASGGGVDDDETRIDVLRVDDSPGVIDQCAVFEFDLSALPAGVQIQSARLELDLAVLESTPTDGPTLTAYGYSGNGTLEPADADETAVVLGQSEMALELGAFEFALDGAGVQELLDAGSVLGLVLQGDASERLLGLRSLESWDGIPPLLTLTYMAPASADFDGDGFTDGGDLAIWQTHFGAQDVDRAHGDADGDGDVDGADLLVWQRTLAAATTATSTPAPEPNSHALMAVCAALAPAYRSTMRRRRSHSSFGARLSAGRLCRVDQEVH